MPRPLAKLAVAAGLAALAACAYEPMGPAAPIGPSSPYDQSLEGPAPTFEAADFAWSTRSGDGAIEGVLAYRSGGERYSCRGGDVILAPETPWSRRRMIILYGSATAAAAPVSIVRDRTRSAPSGDLGRFVRKATCDQTNHFRFDDLPNGAWFVITVARPPSGRGEGVAVTRRVETHGSERTVTLN